MKNTKEEQVELIKAAHDGRVIEFLIMGDEGGWNTKVNLDRWDFGTTTYRVEPQTFDAYLCGDSLCTTCLLPDNIKCGVSRKVKVQVIEND